MKKKLYFKKAIISFSVVFVAISSVGCGKEVYEDNRMQNASTAENTYEFNLYKANIVDSGYNWSSMYYSKLEESESVDMDTLSELKAEVDQKLSLINSLNKRKIEAGYDKYMEDLTKKEDENKKFEKKISSQKSNIDFNISSMKDILSIIKSDLSLADDGKIDSSDRKKINESQKKIIKIYDNMKQIKL